MHPVKRSSDAVAGLADPAPGSKRNKHGGRPKRASAGTKSLPQGYVDPVNAVEDDSDIEEEDANNNDEPARRPWSHRRRALSPLRAISPGHDEPVVSDDVPVAAPALASSTPSMISMTFNLPPGHVGPFVVDLDLASILAHPSTAQRFAIHSAATSSDDTAALVPTRAGFLSLPAELRNMIYRLVFVKEAPINLKTCEGFPRSAALLSTCRQVHYEGCQILYGENVFVLERQPRLRACYYEPQWFEVGWKDVRRFLSTIGPKNISLIRHLTILLADGAKAPGICKPGECCFVDDSNLMDCLKLLAQHGKLQNLSLSINPRRRIRKSDYRFLDNLQEVKGDLVKIIPKPGTGTTHHVNPSYYDPWRLSNMDYVLEPLMLRKMTRKDKLWPGAPTPKILRLPNLHESTAEGRMEEGFLRVWDLYDESDEEYTPLPQLWGRWPRTVRVLAAEHNTIVR